MGYNIIREFYQKGITMSSLSSQKWFRSLFRRRVQITLLLFFQRVFILYIVIGGSRISDIISAGLTALSFIAVLLVVRKREKGAYKLSWVILMLALPVFGGLFYIITELQTHRPKFVRLERQALAKSSALMSLPGTARDEAVSENPDLAPEIDYLEKSAGYPVYSGTRVTYLTPGEAKLAHLLEELEKAEKYIFLEYFIIQGGEMWDEILAVLKRKAAAGVKVRVIYDDFGCFFLLPKDFPAELAKYGIDCRVFNPFRPLLTVVQNNRDHRKIVSIDGKVAFTGGINLADEYINAIELHGHWKDASIMLEGKAAWSMTLMFLTMWQVTTGEEEDMEQYYPWKDAPCTVPSDGFVQPYADTPMDTDNVGEHVYLQLINNAKRYVSITTPYLIIDDSMISALSLAAKSGVDVRLITPHIWDKRFVHETTRSYYPELISAGVRIYEYSPGFIHSKTFVSDDRVATVGTANLDFRSLYMHYECGARFYGSEAVAKVRDDFLDTLEKCAEIRGKDCRVSLPERLTQDLLRLIAPLM